MTNEHAANSDDIVEAFVRELKRGELVDPRGLEGRQVPLFQYVREEIRKSLSRRGALQPGCEWMFLTKEGRFVAYEDRIPVKEREKFDVVARELKKIARSVRIIQRLYPGFPGCPCRLSWAEPLTRVPDKELEADAREAFELITRFSKPNANPQKAYDGITRLSTHWPVLTDGSPFRIMSGLYEYARTGRHDVNTKRACQRVQKARRKFWNPKPPKT